MRKVCYINGIIHDQLDFIIETLSENWPILKTENYANYTKMIKNNSDMLFGMVENESSSEDSSESGDEKEESLKKMKKSTSNKYTEL